MSEFLLVTDDTTRAELAEAISHVGAYAKRQPHVMGDAVHPSMWDRSHARLDSLLTDWELAGA